MVMPDVNVLIGAHRPEHPHHLELVAWLERAVAAPEPLGISLAVAAGFVRVTTSSRIFKHDPTPLEVAVGQIDALLAAPGVMLVHPGPATWEHTRRLCLEAGARGNLVADAAHAALAVENNAMWVTLDRDFARFPGLRWQSPVAPAGAA